MNFYHAYLSFIQINVLDEYFDIKLYLKKLIEREEIEQIGGHDLFQIITSKQWSFRHYQIQVCKITKICSRPQTLNGINASLFNVDTISQHAYLSRLSFAFA